MSVCWMFIILLMCKLSHTTQSQSTCPCNEELKPLCVPVYVPCPIVKAQKMMFYLLKDKEVITNITCNLENNSPSCSQLHGRDGVTLHQGKQNESISFILSELMDNYHGIYRCEGAVTFPPPFKKVQSDLKTQVIAKADIKTCGNNSVQQSHGIVWIWILVVVILSIYSVIITIITFVTWAKLRKMDSQCDYINTKPRVPRERRKKKWALNPIPRHF